jgi:heme/copper-type cytochrome/quinol oxidase subunit 2
MLIKYKKGKREKGKVLILSLITFCLSLTTNAQCAMCRASLESEGNKTRVEAVNAGIVLLMAVPYIIVAVIGFAIYRMYFKKSKAEEVK